MLVEKSWEGCDRAAKLAAVVARRGKITAQLDLLTKFTSQSQPLGSRHSLIHQSPGLDFSYGFTSRVDEQGEQLSRHNLSE